MANRVHALMHAVEPPPLHPPIDRRLAHPERDELSATHDPVLPPRKLSDPSVGRDFSGFSVHMTEKADSPLVRPPRRGSGAAY